MIVMNLARLGVDAPKSYKKEALAEILAENLLDEETMIALLAAFSPEELNFIDTALERHAVMPEDPMEVINLGCYGLIYPDAGGLSLVQDAVELIRKVRWHKNVIMNREALWPLIDYISAFVALYGAVKTDTAIDMFTVYQGEYISKKLLKESLVLTVLRNDFYRIVGDYIIHRSIEEGNAYLDLLDAQGDLPYFMPPKCMIENYADEWYYDKRQSYFKLYDFLKEVSGKSTDDMYQLIDAITYAVQDEEEMSDILEIPEKFEVNFASSEIRARYSMLLTDYMNNTRLWRLKGFTQNEVLKLYSKEKETSESKAPSAQGKVLNFDRQKK